MAGGGRATREPAATSAVFGGVQCRIRPLSLGFFSSPARHQGVIDKPATLFFLAVSNERL